MVKGQIQALLRGNTHKTGSCCSRSCARKLETPRISCICETCFKPFTRVPCEHKKTKHHFCCRTCAAIYNNSHKTTGTRVSKLEYWIQSELAIKYPSIEFHYNKTNAINAELDIYIPSLKLAFELNGIFHYEPIYGKDKLNRIETNDKRKFHACIDAGISLCIIDTSNQKPFSVKTSEKYLTIIESIINEKLNSMSV
jgi:hypothetical protein